MRIVCPNCGAQYEIDDRVIPEGGRDVQCSNCGHAWFEKPHVPHSVFEDEDDWQEAADDGVADDGVAGDTAAEAAEESAPGAEDAASGEQAADEAHERRELDPAVRNLLREEAERELQAREHEREQIETQGDLGLEQADSDTTKRRRTARERMARMRGLDSEEADATGEADNGFRRDLLPDIDEINSSLDAAPAEDMPTLDEEARQSGHSGFRRGFATVIIIACLALAAYVYAPFIIEKYPPSEPYLRGFIALMEQVRGGLDSAAQLATEKLHQLAGEG